MKKQIVLVTLMATLFSCKKEEKKAVDYVLISGNIQHHKEDNLILYKDGGIQKIEIEKDGTFLDTLKLEQGYYVLYNGKKGANLFLTPGDNINITVDVDNFDESISFTGEGAGENNYLKNKKRTIFAITGKHKTLFENDVKSFDEKIKKAKDISEKLLASTTEDISETFKVIEKKNILYHYYQQMNDYPYYYDSYKNIEGTPMPASFRKALQELNKDNEEDYKTIGVYKNLIHVYYEDRLKNKETITTAFDEIKNFNSALIQKNIIQYLSEEAIIPGNENVKLIYDRIMEVSQNDSLKKELKAIYSKIEKIEKGKPSPSFTYENINGGTTSLEELRGKYVYIDIWATWCGPCKKELPYLKELEKTFRNKEITFVSISVDEQKDKVKWKKMTEKQKLKGVQLIADKDWDSDFVKKYLVEAIPRFILLDKEGKIITANAKRPSSPELKSTLNGLL
ncbi:TlpA family protein disulfide reductase [Aquimarina hainanensis]|uniref:TlpA family protein disulfide reductase n=1 Tax=Aquimarina hainanensis TaxID=1578017 RepID=A0ABW5N8A2_9FLAO